MRQKTWRVTGARQDTNMAHGLPNVAHAPGYLGAWLLFDPAACHKSAEYTSTSPLLEWNSTSRASRASPHVAPACAVRHVIAPSASAGAEQLGSPHADTCARRGCKARGTSQPRALLFSRRRRDRANIAQRASEAKHILTPRQALSKSQSRHRPHQCAPTRMR
jgi:hypothetical protein